MRSEGHRAPGQYHKRVILYPIRTGSQGKFTGGTLKQRKAAGFVVDGEPRLPTEPPSFGPSPPPPPESHHSRNGDRPKIGFNRVSDLDDHPTFRP